ncbi:sigma-70 family RNA polymerase sigma factor [Paenibacillus sp. FSL R10-2782]|uniref:sigma-70 family RNA polymerase sigma factor n=1 Tax=Paenibacillus sp. FSL R10-2782 TaxID=2954661 RepID=UPI00315846F9
MQIVVSNFDFLKPVFDFELFKVAHQDKEDVKQTAILRILESVSNYTSEELPENKLFSFCQVIVKRTVADYYRRSSRLIEQKTMSIDWNGYNSKGEISGGGALSPTSDDYSYDIALLRHDFTQHRHLFSPQERKVLEHLLFSRDGIGMNMADICSELNINKSHASRAYKKLRTVCN